MTERIRQLFEKDTVPSFGLDIDISRKANGEYINSTLEDHWQTYQEGAEAAIQECIDILAEYRYKVTWKNEDEIEQPIYRIQRHFGVK